MFLISGRQCQVFLGYGRSSSLPFPMPFCLGYNIILPPHFLHTFLGGHLILELFLPYTYIICGSACSCCIGSCGCSCISCPCICCSCIAWSCACAVCWSCLFSIDNGNAKFGITCFITS